MLATVRSQILISRITGQVPSPVDNAAYGEAVAEVSGRIAAASELPPFAESAFQKKNKKCEVARTPQRCPRNPLLPVRTTRPSSNAPRLCLRTISHSYAMNSGPQNAPKIARKSAEDSRHVSCPCQFCQTILACMRFYLDEFLLLWHMLRQN
jgi:hypothetical protein